MADYKIHKNPKNFDTDRIEFIGMPFKGSGFISKKDGNIGLERCPICGRENYAMNVLSGICTWCGYNAHDINYKY
jgi:ribosomal protein L37E